MLALSTFVIDWLMFLLAARELTARASLTPVRRVVLGILLTLVMTAYTLWMVPSAWALFIVASAAALGSTGMKGDGFQRITEALGGMRFVVYLLSVATLAVLVFVCVPITTFLTSPGELAIHLNFLLSVNARDAMVVVYVAAALYALAMTSRLKTALTLLALGALTLSLVYTFVMPFGYPLMSGLTFEQLPIATGTRVLRVLVDIVAVVAVGLALRLVLLRFGARPIVVGLLLVNVSLAAATTAGFLRDNSGGAGGPSAADATAERPLRFSQTRNNVLFIFLDRFMGSYVESILQTDPEVATKLSGFTWYPRTLSPGENSIAGVHAMLGGYDYTPVEMNKRGELLRDLSTEAFSILPYNFSKKGYRVNVVSPRGLGFTMAGDCKYLEMPGVYCSHIPQSISKRRAVETGFPLDDLSKSNYADLLVLLASMRTTPYVLKEVLYERGPWQPFLNHTAGTTFREWAELHAFPEMSRTDATEPNYNYISNILAHEPYYMGEDCTPQRKPFSIPDKEVVQRGHVSLFSLQHAIAARCALLAVADYMEVLKRAGVYDNTKIVIASDHGIVGAVEDTSTRAVAGGTQDDAFVRTRSLLLVKERGAQGPLSISEEFKPNAEIAHILCMEIGGCVNPYLNDKPIEAFGRDDPFYVSLVPWQFNLQNPRSFVIEQQLVLKGKDPYDVNGWTMLKSKQAPH